MVSDGELNVLEDLLTEAPDQDDELYNPETERDVSDKKGTSTIQILQILLLMLTVSHLYLGVMFNSALCLSGTKRKSERSDSQDLKRLRPSSCHAPSRSSSTNKRAPGPPLSSSSSKKVASSPRGRHAAATTSSYRHEYYEERKGRRGTREPARSRVGDEVRRRESQRGLEGLSQVFLILLLLNNSNDNSSHNAKCD